MEKRKGHVVMVPYPAQGHVNPMMQLGKLLHWKGFHVSFVNTEFNHRRLIRSRGPEFVHAFAGFTFETIPDGLPPSERDATQDVPSLSDSTRKHCLAPFKDLLLRLNSSHLPSVSLIISDGIMGFAIQAARDFAIPHLRLWTSSPGSLIGCWMFQPLLLSGVVPFKDESFMHDGTLDTPIDCPGMTNMRLKDLPTFIRTLSADDIMFDFIGSEARSCLTSPALLFNTFEELDSKILAAISERYPRPNNIYNIGPLPLLLRHVPDESQLKPLSSSLWKEDLACLKWLDEREPNSVVYVNYGSVTTMTQDNLREFAWGLVKSNHYFLWIVRPDVVGSESAAAGLLPDEFFEEIKERGLLATWCPQVRVLSHPAVGVFLSHCGWNSTMESVSCGVPIMCWPFFGDQQMNCRLACTKWGVGVEVDSDVKRHQVAALVNEVMDSPKGKAMREKAFHWKLKALQATDVGGSSYIQFHTFVNQALTHPASFLN